MRLLTPALSSFEEERENYFVGRFPGVASASQPYPGLISFAPTGLRSGFGRASRELVKLVSELQRLRGEGSRLRQLSSRLCALIAVN
jgi:hypothetical protein